MILPDYHHSGTFKVHSFQQNLKVSTADVSKVASLKHIQMNIFVILTQVTIKRFKNFFCLSLIKGVLIRAFEVTLIGDQNQYNSSEATTISGSIQLKKSCENLLVR